MSVGQTSLSPSPFEEFCSALCDHPNHNWYGILARWSKAQLGKRSLQKLSGEERVALVSSLSPPELLQLLYRYGFASDRQNFRALEDYKNLDVRRLQFVYEFLQNSEDARASLCRFEIDQHQIVVFNDGECFDARNLYAICSFNESDKQAREGKQIGKFGVGFKSVFRLTARPTVQTFDRKRGIQLAFRFFEPGAIDEGYYRSVLEEAPLDYSIKLPVAARESFFREVGYILPECVEWDSKLKLEEQQQGSLFLLPLREMSRPADVSQSLRDALSPEVFLFLRLSDIEIVDRTAKKPAKYAIRKELQWSDKGEHGEIACFSVKESEASHTFLVYSQPCALQPEQRERFLDLTPPERKRLPESFLIQVACALTDGGEVAHLGRAGQVFSFLPVPELGTRLNCHVNAPFNLTKSRGNLVEDDFNEWLIQQATQAYLHFLGQLRQKQAYRPGLFLLLPDPPATEAPVSDRLNALYQALERYAVQEGYVPVHGSDELYQPDQVLIASANLAGPAITHLILASSCLENRRLAIRDSRVLRLHEHFDVENLHRDDLWKRLTRVRDTLLQVLKKDELALEGLFELFSQANPPQEFRDLALVEGHDGHPRALDNAAYPADPVPDDLGEILPNALPTENWISKESALRLISLCPQKHREGLTKKGLLPRGVTPEDLSLLAFESIERQQPRSPEFLELLQYLVRAQVFSLSEERRRELGKQLKVDLVDGEGTRRPVFLSQTLNLDRQELAATPSLVKVLRALYSEAPGMETLVGVFGGILAGSTFLEILAHRIQGDLDALAWMVRYLSSLKNTRGVKWRDEGYPQVLVSLRLPAIGSPEWTSADELFSEGFGLEVSREDGEALGAVLGARCVDWEALPAGFPKSELASLLQSLQDSAVYVPTLDDLREALSNLEEEDDPEERMRGARVLAEYIARVADPLERKRGQRVRIELKPLLSSNNWLSGRKGRPTSPSELIEPHLWGAFSSRSDVPGIPYPSPELDQLASALEKVQKGGWVEFSKRGGEIVAALLQSLLTQLQDEEERAEALVQLTELHRQKLLADPHLAKIRALLKGTRISVDQADFRAGQLILFARDTGLLKEGRAEFPFLMLLPEKGVLPLHRLLANVRDYRGKPRFLSDADCVRLALPELLRWPEFDQVQHREVLLAFYRGLEALGTELYPPEELVLWTQAGTFVGRSSKVWSGHSPVVRALLQELSPEHLLNEEAREALSTTVLEPLGILADGAYRVGEQILQEVKLQGVEPCEADWVGSPALGKVVRELERTFKGEVSKVSLCDRIEVIRRLRGTEFHQSESVAWKVGYQSDPSTLLLTRAFLPDLEKRLRPYLQSEAEKQFYEEIQSSRREIEGIARDQKRALGHVYRMTTADMAFREEVDQLKSKGLSEEDASWKALQAPGKRRMEHLVFLYTSQRGYGVETLVRELLQNIDDAYAGFDSEGRARFRFSEKELTVTHWGRGFNQRAPDNSVRNDILRICSLGGSEKANQGPQAEIGRFGLGFKSVFQVTDEPFVESHPYYFSIEFLVVPKPGLGPEPNPQLTLDEIRKRVRFRLKASNHEQRLALGSLSQKVQNGLDLYAEQLLFLRRLSRVEAELPDGGQLELLSTRGEKGPLGLKDYLVHLNNDRTYLILPGRGRVDLGKLVLTEPTIRELGFALAFAWDVRQGLFANFPLAGSPLFLFLPTQENTHLPFLVHGEFATDAGRNTVPYQGDFSCNVELARHAASLYERALRTGFAHWKDDPRRVASLYSIVPSAQAAVPDFLSDFQDAFARLLEAGEQVVLTSDGALVSMSEFRDGGKEVREAWEQLRRRLPSLPPIAFIARQEFGETDVGKLVRGLLDIGEREREVAFDALAEHVIAHTKGADTFQGILSLLAYCRQKGAEAGDALEQLKRPLRNRPWVLTEAGGLARPDALHLVKSPEIHFCILPEERIDLNALSWTEKDRDWLLSLLGQLEAHSYLSAEKLRKVIEGALTVPQAECLARYVGGKQNYNENYAKVLNRATDLVTSMIRSSWFPSATGRLLAPNKVKSRLELPPKLLKQLDPGFVHRLFPDLDEEDNEPTPILRQTDQEVIFAENLRRLDRWWQGREVKSELVTELWEVLGLKAAVERRAEVLARTLEDEDQDEIWFRLLCAANILQSERRHQEGIDFLKIFERDFDGFSRLFEADDHSIVGVLVDQVIQKGCAQVDFERAYFWRRIYDFYKIRVLIQEKGFLEDLFQVMINKPGLIAEYLHRGTGVSKKRRHHGLRASLVNQCFFLIRELFRLGVLEEDEVRDQAYYLNRHTRRLLVKLLAPIPSKEMLEFEDHARDSERIHEIVHETLNNDDFQNAFDLPFFSYHQTFCSRCTEMSPPSGCELLCKWRSRSQEGFLEESSR